MGAEAHVEEGSEEAGGHLQRVAHEVRDVERAHTAFADVRADAHNGRCLKALHSSGSVQYSMRYENCKYNTENHNKCVLNHQRLLTVMSI